jgi:hypothetical protein
MKIKFSFFNDLNRSEYLKEFFVMPAFSWIVSNMYNGISLRWGFWGVFILCKRFKK